MSFTVQHVPSQRPHIFCQNCQTMLMLLASAISGQGEEKVMKSKQCLLCLHFLPNGRELSSYKTSYAYDGCCCWC